MGQIANLALNSYAVSFQIGLSATKKKKKRGGGQRRPVTVESDLNEKREEKAK